MFKWNSDKNKLLYETRGITFDEVVQAIADGFAISDSPHPNAEKYPNQRVLSIALYDYVYLVPYVIDGNDYFLKTIIPSRKANRQHKGGRK
jgi:uncharacterized DUF497 family protein